MNQTETALELRGENLPALKLAVEMWAARTTDASSPRREDYLRDKRGVVLSFFAFAGKHPAEVVPADVKRWREHLEGRNLKETTVYHWLSLVSSFYEWVIAAGNLDPGLRLNPARPALPKPPKPYSSGSAKSLEDWELAALLGEVEQKAVRGNVVAKRDLAILLLYVLTGLRRQEVIRLTGRDVVLREDRVTVRTKVKGGEFRSLAVADPSVREALLDYLSASGRAGALSSPAPLWTRHDHAGRPGAALTSHAFVKNLKRYALRAGIGEVRLHQTRHTFGRIVSEETGSMEKVQEALGHRNRSTTHVYVAQIVEKRDLYSGRILDRLKGARRPSGES